MKYIQPETKEKDSGRSHPDFFGGERGHTLHELFGSYVSHPEKKLGGRCNVFSKSKSWIWETNYISHPRTRTTPTFLGPVGFAASKKKGGRRKGGALTNERIPFPKPAPGKKRRRFENRTRESLHCRERTHSAVHLLCLVHGHTGKYSYLPWANPPPSGLRCA